MVFLCKIYYSFLCFQCTLYHLPPSPPPASLVVLFVILYIGGYDDDSFMADTPHFLCINSADMPHFYALIHNLQGNTVDAIQKLSCIS